MNGHGSRPSPFEARTRAPQGDGERLRDEYMDFSLSPEIEDLRLRVRAFIDKEVLPLEADPANFSEHENIPHERLEPVREKARAAGLWAPQSPKEYGGMELPMVAWAAIYEEAARSPVRPARDQLHGAGRRQHEHAAAGRHARRRRTSGSSPSSRARCARPSP